MTAKFPLVALGRPLQPKPRKTPPLFALRVSALESCQLRCRYCLPGAVQPASKRNAWLTPDEHARVAPLLAERGVRKVRFTGGEPLLRDDLPEVIGAWRRALPDADLALTTNGLLLHERLDALVDAGLDRLNVHLDTLRADRVQALMGGGDPDACLASVAAAHAAGVPVKMNMVVQRDLNDDELPAFLEVSKALGVQVRFIELMDTGSASDAVRRSFISGEDILRRLAAAVRFESAPRRCASDPAELFQTEDGVIFGLIASDTRPFCDACDRLRLGATGVLRGCLYAPDGLNLGRALRGGLDDARLGAQLDEAIGAKASWHPQAGQARRPFSMADVGG